MNDQYSIAKERGMIGSNGQVDLSTINHRTDILPVETETVDVSSSTSTIPDKGDLSADTIDFSRISTSSAGVAGMQFISSDRILKQYWGDNGKLTYEKRADGTIAIKEGDQILGFTDEQGIRNAIGANKPTPDTKNISSTDKGGQNTSAQQAKESAQRQKDNVTQKSAMAGDPRFDGPSNEGHQPNLADVNHRSDISSNNNNTATASTNSGKAPNLADYNQNPSVKDYGGTTATASTNSGKAPNLADYNQNPSVKDYNSTTATASAPASTPNNTTSTVADNRGFPSSTEGFQNSTYQQTAQKNVDLQAQYDQLSQQRDDLNTRLADLRQNAGSNPELVRQGNEAAKEYTRVSKEMTNIENEIKANNEAQAATVRQVADARTQTAFKPEATGTTKMTEEIAELRKSSDPDDIAKADFLQQSVDSIEDFYGSGRIS